MTRRPPRRTTRRTVTAALAGALALGVAGCGTTDALVGLRPAPAESPDAAPLDTQGATDIAARLLDAAAAVAATKGEKGHDARAKVMTGDALTVADRVALSGAADDTSGQLAKEAEPTVLAQSRGRDWPRAILATTLDGATNTQYLHVMVSTTPEEPFRITSSVPMFGGAQLPAVGAEDTGAPFVDPADGDGLVMSPRAAFAGYAKAIARPSPKKMPENVSTEDVYAQALHDSAVAQSKALGKLGKLTQGHKPYLDDAVAFRLADGGVVAFGLFRRTDTFTVGEGAKELVLPKRYADVVGEKRVQKSMKLMSVEPVVLVVPTEGDVTAIGASELLYSGEGD